MVTRFGKASVQRWAAGISGVTLSGSNSVSFPAESVAAVEGNRVRLSTAGNAATQQEKSGGPVSDKRS